MVILTYLSVFLLSAHVSSQVARADIHVWPAALALATVDAARRARGGGCADALAPGTHFLVAFGGLAWAVDAFGVFARAFASLPLTLFLLQIAQRRGLVHYDVSSSRFVVVRASAYALLRATGEVLRVRASVPVRIVRLVPFAVGLLETAGMRVLGHGGAYAFSVSSDDFVVYSTLKSAAFLAAPYLEDALATPPGWW